MSDNTDPKRDAAPLEEGDWIVRQFLSPSDLQMSPEEYAARYAHLWGCFSLDRYRYADPALGAWVRRLAEILSSGEELERCRHRLLTPDELAQVRKEEAEEL